MASCFTVEPLPPFRLDATVWALRRRPGNVVDRWDGITYRRALRLTDAVAEIEVHQAGPPEAPRLVVSVASDRPVRYLATST
jgi:DNA-3-methyladenine glycosylase II